MTYVKAADGTNIFVKDWGERTARPFVFSHGWPLSADAWDGQMLFLVQQGYRVVAHDRRGHGRSDQPADGNDMDTYADDLAAVMQALDLADAIMVGHSTGGGEVVRYIGRHGSERVAKVVLVGAVPPIMISTDEWPGGLGMKVFDGIRKNVSDNRSSFYLELASSFFGFNREGASVDEGLRQSFWRQGMTGSILGQYLCVREFSEVDFTEDLRATDKPVLIVQGDDDQIVPLEHSGALAAEIIRDAELKVYPGAPHGLPSTHQDRLNADLLSFAGQARSIS